MPIPLTLLRRPDSPRMSDWDSSSRFSDPSRSTCPLPCNLWFWGSAMLPLADAISSPTGIPIPDSLLPSRDVSACDRLRPLCSVSAMFLPSMTLLPSVRSGSPPDISRMLSSRPLSLVSATNQRRCLMCGALTLQAGSIPDPMR